MTPDEALAQLDELRSQPGGFDPSAHGFLYATAYPTPAAPPEEGLSPDRRATDAELGPALAALRATYEAREAEGPARPFVPAAHPRTRSQLADISRAIVTQARARPDFDASALEDYYRQIAAEDPAPPALPHAAVWPEDLATIEAGLAQSLGTEMSEIQHWRDRGVEYLRGPAARPDPAQTARALRSRYGAETDAKLAAAHRFIATWPERVRDYLEDTGLGDDPNVIARVVELAEARARRD